MTWQLNITGSGSAEGAKAAQKAFQSAVQTILQASPQTNDLNGYVSGQEGSQPFRLTVEEVKQQMQDKNTQHGGGSRNSSGNTGGAATA